MTKRNTGLIDQNGNPILVDVLRSEQAGATVGGIRSAWRDTIASGLEPSKLASILKDAAEGNTEAYLTLAEEMEERDTHYASVLGQRKRAVSLIEPIITPTEAGSDEITAAVETLVTKPIFNDAVDDLLDGIAKGYACVEPIWGDDAELWDVNEYKFRDPRFFTFDKETGQNLLIKDEDYPLGKEIPLYSMIVHRPKLKSGLPARGGLARLVSWAFMLKAFTLQDWAAFLEVFGMPFRVGKYDDAAGADEKRTLLRAVRDMGTDAAAIIPKSMDIEFIESKGGQGNAVFGAMTDYLDKQISKAVVGQTMTTDDGSSRSQAEVHSDVKLDIQKSDARQLASTINRDLIAPFVALNFGPQAPVPVFKFPVPDPEDIALLSDMLTKLVPMGLKVSSKDVRKRIGFGAPADDEEILTAPALLASPDKNKETPEAKKEKANLQPCKSCGEVHLATEKDDEDPLVEDALNEWQPDLQPLVDQVLAAAGNSSGFEEFVVALNELDPDTAQLANSLAKTAMKAKGDGDLINKAAGDGNGE